MVAPINAGYIRATIDAVREQIGRTVVFHIPNPAPSYTGLFNPKTDTRYIVTTRDEEVLARIHWTNDEAVTTTPGGKYYQGECYIHIVPEDLSIAEATQSENGTVTVDGHEMTISKIIPQGAPTINRIRLILVGTGNRPNT